MDFYAEMQQKLLNPPPPFVEYDRPQSRLERLVQNQLGNSGICDSFHDRGLFEEISKKIDSSRTVSVFGHDKDFGLVQFVIKVNQKDDVVAGFVYYEDKGNKKSRLYSLTYFKEKGNDVVLYYRHDFEDEINWTDFSKIEMVCTDKKGYSRRVWENIYKSAKDLEKRREEMEKEPKKYEKGIEKEKRRRYREPKVTV